MSPLWVVDQCNMFRTGSTAGGYQLPFVVARKGGFKHFAAYDGKVIVSGAMKFPGNFWFTSLARFNVDGSRDNTFFTSGLGGGTIVAWGDQFYAAGPQTVRRLDLEGNPDPSFIQMNSDPLFHSLQGGDYHVYPDGRVLMSGAHELLDTARGFTGLYNLIWFTNTGHVDTTKIHRKGNQVLGEPEPLADGKFLVNGTCTVYEGHPVGRVFRIHADGSLDTNLHTTLNWGDVDAFLPLPDGRFYAAGIYRQNGFPDDTLRLARFLPNGELDNTFNSPHFEFQGQSNPGGLGPPMRSLQFTEEGDLLVTGGFQLVNGESRKGLCVVETSGNLLDTFANAGVGRYYYMGFPFAFVRGYMPMDNGMAYIWGSYHGYNDGTTNDTLQRFVTRLFGPDFSTSVQEESPQKAFALYPNPAHGTVELRIAHPPAGTVRVLIYDPSGRQVLQRSVSNTATQLDVGPLANGIYLVELEQVGQRLGATRLVVQH